MRYLEETDVINLLEAFKVIHETLPKPFSGFEVVFPTKHSYRKYRCITHYDPESVDLWNAIDAFKKAIFRK